jgi:ectoine hydroxylase-related dioxygenase (phytanoyl-CoA dioxygenase family)
MIRTDATSGHFDWTGRGSEHQSTLARNSPLRTIAMLAEDLTASRKPVSDTAFQETLAAQGYLVIDRITDDAEVSRIRLICEALFDKKVGYEEGQYFNMVGADDDDAGPKLPQILHPRIYAPELRRTRFFANAQALARQLLGPKARFGFDHVIKKPAFDGAATPWHQDEAFRDPAYDYDEISIWLPLQDVDERNGCMEYIPGVDPGGVLPHRSPSGDTSVHGVECFAGFDPRDKVVCALRVGACVVHTGRTVHGAGANHTDAPRFAYVLVFDLPRRRRTTQRKFPWLDEKKTARMERERVWRYSFGGFLVRARRKLEQLLTMRHKAA